MLRPARRMPVFPARLTRKSGMVFLHFGDEHVFSFYFAELSNFFSIQ
jgi:hypothetical protein